MPDESSSDGGGATDAGATASSATRRGFLAAVGGTVAAGASQSTAAQEETYRFGGEVAAWRGEAPDAIAGEDNPTLDLEPGTEYEVVWENLDGAPHDFVIQDGSGNEIVGTDTVQEEGETATLTFTASPETAQYVCTIHPTTMVGEIQVGGGAPAEGETGLPLELLLMGAAALAAFLSPLAFALLLFRNRDEGRPAPRPGD